MSDDLQDLVRRSLDTVDRSKRIATALIALLFLVVVFALDFLMMHAPTGEMTGAIAYKVMWVLAAAQMAFVGLCAALVAGHVTRMTKAVLRAIELASK
jgi:hypothetical protein